MSRLDDKNARALDLIAKKVPSAAICERLGISRNQLYQIKHRAQKARQPAQQLDGEYLKT